MLGGVVPRRDLSTFTTFPLHPPFQLKNTTHNPPFDFRDNATMSNIAPIVGKLRKGLVMDLSVALGIGVGQSASPFSSIPRLTTCLPPGVGYWFWYGT